MHCLECARERVPNDAVVIAVGICAHCGAGVCLNHAHVSPRHLTRTMANNRQVPVEPPAQRIDCSVCAAAQVSLSRHW